MLLSATVDVFALALTLATLWHKLSHGRSNLEVIRCSGASIKGIGFFQRQLNGRRCHAMNISQNWDTAMVLTAVLAPLSLLFVGIIFKQWQRINELKHDLKAVSAEEAELQAAVQNRDEEIDRQRKTLRALHSGEIAKLNENHTQEIHRLVELYSSGKGILPPKSILMEQERKQQGA